MINTSIVNGPAQALIKRNPQVARNIDLKSSSWDQSLFQQLGSVKRQKIDKK